MPTTPTIHASTPAAVQGSTATTSTAAFTPPAGAWIVVSAQGDANTGATDERLTVATTAAGITFLPVVFLTGVAAATEIWAAYVSSSQSMTIDLTDNKGAVAKRMVPRVYTDMGGIGASATIASSLSISYTATAENSLGIACGLGSNIAAVAGTGCTVIDEQTGFDSGDGIWTVGRTASLGTLAGTTVTLSVTGPTGIRLVAAELLPTVVGPPPVVPPPWLIQQLLLARQTAASAPQGAITINGTATIAGAGAVATTTTQQATAAPAGAGSAAVTVVQQSTATATGVGALAPAPVTQAASAAPAGAGSLTTVTTTSVTSSATGAGTLTALAVLRSGSAITGAGALTAAGTVAAPAAATGAGSLTANVTEIATAAPTGVSGLTAVGASSGAATASLTGAGSLTATAVQVATATAAGTGTLVSSATQRAAAGLSGAGTVTAVGQVFGVVLGTATLVGASSLVATAVPQPSTIVYHLEGVTAAHAVVEPATAGEMATDSRPGSSGGDHGVSAAGVRADGVTGGHVFE